MKLSNLFKKMVRLGNKCVLAVLLLSLAQVLTLKFVDPPFTVAILVDCIKTKFTKLPYTPPLYKWSNMAHISKYVPKAVIAAEDQRFLDHWGFDLIEIKEALLDIASGRRLRGASTISMQTARSVFLPVSKSIARKLAEAYYTILIEIIWGKQRILEVYLNTVDWGNGIVGIEAASRRYFHIPSSRIRADQAALLAAILPNPHKWSPITPTDYIVVRKKRILKEMRMLESSF